MKKIVLVGGDAAPSRAFVKLEPVLRERGFEVVLYVGDGKPIGISEETIKSDIEGASVVLLGMSSKINAFEVAAGLAAIEAGVPYGFYGDVPLCWKRARPGSPFEALATHASFYLGVSQKDADAAREVFPNAKLIGSGNPLREDYAFPRFSRDEVRAKLGIVPGETLVLAVGCAFSRENLTSWLLIMEALALIEQDKKSRLILTTHPSDPFPLADYGRLISLSPVATEIARVFSTTDIAPGADIILEFSSANAIQGGFLNIPVVTLGLESLFRKIEKERGNQELEAVQTGISELVVADPHKLAETISRLLTPEGFAPMKIRQRAACPKPTERGAALKAMADAIEQIAGS